MALDLPSYLLGKSKGTGGTSDYADLTNKPSINGVTLNGNKTSADLGIGGGDEPLVITSSNYQDSDVIDKLNEKFEKYLIGESYNIYIKTKVVSTIDRTIPVKFTVDSRGSLCSLSSDYFAYSSGTTSGGHRIGFVSISLNWENGKIKNISSFPNSAYRAIIGGFVAYDSTSFIPATNNATAWTPSGNYNLVHKKYVDDAIASAITDALGGNY
jgi:hypothetical protein